MHLNIELRDQRRRPFAAGHAYAGAGVYEVVQATAHFWYRPAEDAAGQGHDLALAETGADGVARGQADVWLLRPVDLARTSGTLVFEFLNRGNKRSLQFFNDAVGHNDPTEPAHAGNGWLMRQGHMLCSAAWQADVLPGQRRQVLQVPVARHAEGPVTDEVVAEFIADLPGVRCMPLSGKPSTRSHPVHAPRRADARLTRRRYPWSAPEPVPGTSWDFARIERGDGGASGDRADGDEAIVPSDVHLLLHDGFAPGWIYQLHYTAQAPLVLDLGFALVRDLVSALRTWDDARNPLAQDGRPRVRKVLAWGRSQAGRAIREFVYRGFNADSRGARVFDGVLPHVAGAGRVNMNRFSNLDIPASRQYENHDHPADRFPFAYGPAHDPVTGRQDAILQRPATDPLVIHTQTSTEYWNRRGALVHTDAQGQDLPVPDGVRIYAWTGSQHWADPNVRDVQHGICQQLPNVVATSAMLRAALHLLDHWVDGVAPPPSSHPKRADGTLVDFEDWRAAFPRIPSVNLPIGPNTLEAVDHGTVFDEGRASPTQAQGAAPVAVKIGVPASDADGIDLGGVRPPMAAAPAATALGWNLRRRGFGEAALHDFSGSWIALPTHAAHAQAAGDPRAAFFARYGDMDGYGQAVRDHAAQLGAAGFLLDEDIDAAVQTAVYWARRIHAPTHDN